VESQADPDSPQNADAARPTADEAAAPPASPAERQAAAVLAALHPMIPDATAQAHGEYVETFVPTSHLVEAARRLKLDLGYELLSMVTAVDWPDRIEVVYLAYALEHPNGVLLKTNLPREALPECPSLTPVWPGADFQERETYDLMGINFVGHPDLRRILTEDDFPGHPLRKDFTLAPDYVLMRHLRFGAEGQLRPETAEAEDQT
jgi:NADH:ubiquinone oxidoreductase subunit C